MVKNNNIDTQEHEKEKILCAVKNPSKRSFQSWFYNQFLEGLSKKPKKKCIKVNWIMKLTNDEIKLLKEKTCLIIKIEKNNNKTDVEIDV